MVRAKNAVDRPVDCKVNGKVKFHGFVQSTGQKLAFYIEGS